MYLSKYYYPINPSFEVIPTSSNTFLLFVYLFMINILPMKIKILPWPSNLKYSSIPVSMPTNVKGNLVHNLLAVVRRYRRRRYATAVEGEWLWGWLHSPIKVWGTHSLAGRTPDPLTVRLEVARRRVRRSSAAWSCTTVKFAKLLS